MVVNAVQNAKTLLSLTVAQERDIVPVRQRARELAALLGFETQDQIRIATTLSELARNAFQYAGGGEIVFSVAEKTIYHKIDGYLAVDIRDRGPGIAEIDAILDGNYVSRTGMGVGLAGARRLMDYFEIETGPGGTRITTGKKLPRAPDGTTALSGRRLDAVLKAIAAAIPADPFLELQNQNRELMTAFREIEKQRQEVMQLNQELEETNRGVVALYAELDQRADYLKRASELKSQFLSNITHEFRTPLNSIRSISTMLLDRMDGELNDEQVRQVTYIKTGAEALSHLVNDLLDMAKIEAGKLSVRISNFSIADTFGMLRGMLKPLLEKNSLIRLVFDEPGDRIPNLSTDEEKISQILRNFISNGLKYTERGEVRVSVAMHGRARVKFTVADTGIGISAEDQDRIFEEFVQVENQQQLKSKGTGLGLPLTKKLATLLGGTVEVVSTPGLGSVFSLIVPIIYHGDDSVAAMPKSHAALRGKPAILIIDDNDADRYVLNKMLRHFEADIYEAGNGTTGLQMAAHLMPDCIFLDLNMPDISGFEALRRLKTDDALSAVPVIVNSSKHLDREESAFLAEHTVLVLAKGELLEEHSLTTIKNMLKSYRISTIQDSVTDETSGIDS